MAGDLGKRILGRGCGQCQPVGLDSRDGEMPQRESYQELWPGSRSNLGVGGPARRGGLRSILGTWNFS